jgi:hypothetical protein
MLTTTRRFLACSLTATSLAAVSTLGGCVVAIGNKGADKSRDPASFDISTSKGGAAGSSLAPAVPVNPAVEPLAFMAGRWIQVTPRGVVHEEHWTAPRQGNLLGMYRVLRADGTVGINEATSIDVEPEGVTLRLRHMHGKLEILPEDNRPLMVFRLESVSANTARFVAVRDTRDVSAVTYSLQGPFTLQVTLDFFESAKRQQDVFAYARLPGNQ